MTVETTPLGQSDARSCYASSLCACGCGQPLVRAASVSLAQFKKHRYIKGHFYNDKAFQEKRIAGIKRAFGEGKMQHAVHQTPEFIEKRVRSLRGRKRPEAACEATAVGVRKAWAEGKYSGGTVGKNGSRVGGTPAQMDAIRGMRDMEKLKANNSEKLKNQMAEWKESGKLDDIRRKAGNLKDTPDHLAAKRWIIRDPQGKIHAFSNLASWARKNTHLFVDDRPESKAPLWLRIAGGIADLLKANGRSCSYRGWVAVSKTELESGGADLLGRLPHKTQAQRQRGLSGKEMMNDLNDTSGERGGGSLERVVGPQLLLQWRTRYQQITECADSNDRRGDMNAARQLRAQAFGVKECADELDARMRPNASDQATASK